MTCFPKVLLLYLQPVTHLFLNIGMLVWFNSPLIKDLVSLVPKQPNEIGCNHLYTLRSVDNCVAYDPRTRDQIDQDIKSPKSPKTPNLPKFWTRNGCKTDLFDEVVTPNRLQPQDSGTLAIALAIFYLKAKDITVLGCGWHTKDTKSLFDHRYTHKKWFEKGNNSKLQLLRTYQKEFGVRIRFVSEHIVDPALGHARVEDLLHELS